MAWSPGREWAVLAAILALYGVLLGRALAYDFVWDDVHEIEHNTAFDRPLTSGLFQTQTARTDPALTELSTLELAYDSYRPLLFASLWIDVQLWGRSPAPLHAVNLVLGAIAILLAHALARRLLGGAIALIPTALFALHPIQIEAVAYISGRGDVLAGMFALLAGLGAVCALDASSLRPAAAWTALAAIAFAASLLSKEAYVGLPIVVASIALLARRLRGRWWVPTILAAVCAGYLLVRAAIVASTQSHALQSGMLGLPGVWLDYLRIVALPFELSTERIRSPGYAIPGALLAAAVLVAIVVLARRPTLARNTRTAIVAIVWMGVLLAPAAVPIASTQVVADRYFYAPMFGLALAATASLARIAELRPRLRWPFAIIGALSGTMWLLVTWRQVPVWQNNRTLYLHAVEMSPDSSMAHYRVGYLDAHAGRWDEAISRFERAIALDSKNLFALNNLGVGYLRTGQLDSAARQLTTAVTVNPAHFRAWLNLGLTQWSLGNRAQGCASISRALEINPGYASAIREAQQRCGQPPSQQLSP